MNRLEFRNELRKRIRDWYTPDTLAANITSTTATNFTATLGSYYRKGNVVGIDSEEMLVRDIDVNMITVVRGWHGTTPATHTSGTTIRIFNFFSDAELNSYIDRAVLSLWPDIYGQGVDETLTLDSNTYSYDIPTAVTNAEGRIVSMEVLDDNGRPTPMPYEIWGGKIYLRSPRSGTARIKYIYRYQPPATDTNDVATDEVANLAMLEAQVATWDAVMLDRDKYERYVTSQWQDNATGYEIAAHVDSLKESAIRERERLRRALPGTWRWA